MNPTSDYVQDFINRHSSDGKTPAYQIPKTTRYLFADGAIWQPSPLDDGMDGTVEPPEGDYERWQLIQKYWKIVTEDAVARFDEFRNGLQVQILHAQKYHRNPAFLPDRETSVARLKQLKGKVTAAQRKLKHAAKMVDEHVPFWIRQREEQERQTVEQAILLLSEFNTVQV